MAGQLCSPVGAEGAKCQPVDQPGQSPARADLNLGETNRPEITSIWNVLLIDLSSNNLAHLAPVLSVWTLTEERRGEERRGEDPSLGPRLAVQQVEAVVPGRWCASVPRIQGSSCYFPTNCDLLFSSLLFSLIQSTKSETRRSRQDPGLAGTADNSLYRPATPLHQLSVEAVFVLNWSRYDFLHQCWWWWWWWW